MNERTNEWMHEFVVKSCRYFPGQFVSNSFKVSFVNMFCHQGFHKWTIICALNSKQYFVVHINVCIETYSSTLPRFWINMQAWLQMFIKHWFVPEFRRPHRRKHTDPNYISDLFKLSRMNGNVNLVLIVFYCYSDTTSLSYYWWKKK